MEDREGVEGFSARGRALGALPAWWDAVVDCVDREMARDGGHEWGHLTRVLVNAHTLLTREEASPDGVCAPGEVSWPALAASVALHDIVNVPKDHPRRREASTMSADRAVEVLAALDALSEDERAEVHAAIRCHSFSSGFVAERPLGQLLSDADRLDALGAVGLARMFATGGALGRPICHPHDPLASERPLDDLMWSLDHIPRKLLTLRERMYTETGRALATARHEYLLSFQAQLASELFGRT